MSIQTLGLWLAPAPETMSLRRQVKAVARQAETLRPDMVLFPEGWCQAASAANSADLVAELMRPLTEAGIRCLVGVGVDNNAGPHAGAGAQLLVDAGTKQRPYMKQTSAGHVATQEDGWRPSLNLPVWKDHVAPTICHDMYLSLFAHYQSRAGGRLFVNPSGGSVVERKWAAILSARAVEVQAPFACTMTAPAPREKTATPGRRSGATRCWVMGANGGPLELKSSLMPQATRVGSEAGQLYVADLAAIGSSLDRIKGKPAGDREARVKIDGDRLRIGAESSAWGNRGEHVRGFRVVCITGREMRNPCPWLQPLLEEGPNGRCLYWIRASRTRRDEAVLLARAKAIETCCPCVIETNGGRPIVVELHNYSKGVRVNDPATLSSTWQLGYNSAFKMLCGGTQSANAWKTNLPRYEQLLWSCRR